MNVVFYGRYSALGQSEQSIEGQRKVCYEFAERNGYKIIAEYIDRAISGTDADNRPEFQRMIADSAKRQFQGVLVYQLDRFARNRYDSATYKSKLKKNGVKVLSARENISDDASGVLMESVLEGMAEYFSAELSQKVKRGLALTAEKCEYTGSYAPLGYKVVDKKIVLHEDEFLVVKRMFDMYISGKTMVDIIRHLDSIGIKTRHGNSYHKDTIRRILTNRKYLGIYIYDGVEVADGIPRIIDDSTFNEAQEMLAKNKKAPARQKAVEENYLLTTKLFCGHCLSAIVGDSGHSRNGTIHQYYRCITRKRKGSCSMKTIKKTDLENLVVKRVLDGLTDEKINKMAKEIADLSIAESNTDTIKRLRKSLKENEIATANLIKAIEAGKAVDVISEQIEKRQNEKKDLESRIAHEMLMRPVLTFEEVKFFFERFKCGDVSDYNYRTSVIDVLVDKILVYDGDNARVEIYCRASENCLEMPISEPHQSGSDKAHLAPQAGLEPATLRLTAACSTN